MKINKIKEERKKEETLTKTFFSTSYKTYYLSIKKSILFYFFLNAHSDSPLPFYGFYPKIIIMVKFLFLNQIILTQKKYKFFIESI